MVAKVVSDERLSWRYGDWSVISNNRDISHEALNKVPVLSNLLNEVFQNVLDARSRRLRLKWTVVERSQMGAMAWDEVRERAGATRFGWRDDGSDELLCLVIEDYGCGLGGPYDRTPRPNQVPGGFQAFARGIGNSSKVAGQNGSKGIGRLASLISSLLKTVYVHTKRREDGLDLFFGMSVLDHHTYRGVDYQFDGLMMLAAEAEGGLRVPPSGDAAIRAARAVGLDRPAGEFGTSILVPALRDSITLDNVCREILTELFMPIVAGALTVELVGMDKDGLEERPLVIDAASIYDIAASGAYGVDAQRALLIHTARRAWEARKCIRFDAGFPDAPLTDGFIEGDDLQSAVEAYEADGTFAATASFLARRRTTGEEGAGSIVFAVAAESGLTTGAEILIRDGISVVRELPGRPFVVLTIAGTPFFDGEGERPTDRVAEMLRDGENTSHNQWHVATMEKLGWTPAHAKLVADSFRGTGLALVNTLNRQSRIRDTTTFGDIFSFRSPESTGGRSQKKGERAKGGQREAGEPREGEENPFRLFLTDPDENGRWGLGIEMVPEAKKRRGRPTDITAVFGFYYASTESGKTNRRHTLADFDLRSSEFEIVAQNCAGIQRGPKSILVSAPKPGFCLTVRGPFDPYRQLEAVLETMARAATPKSAA